jgi:superfamily I DNA/RNA helicase
LSGGKESIQKPMKLLVNYRSHSGILNCASAVLEKMFALFPGCAKVLPKDSGLYIGPRPVYFQADITKKSQNDLYHILKSNERLVVLCPDVVADTLEGLLQVNEVSNIILGVREAKGLEFPDVALVDFFSSIPYTDQRYGNLMKSLNIIYII